MSRGFGRAERFILKEVVEGPMDWRSSDGERHFQEGAGLPPHIGVPLLWLAERYAERQGVTYTRSVVETVRRAARNLERKGLITTDYRLTPTAELSYDARRGRRVRTGRYEKRARWKRMLLVGGPGQAGLALDYFTAPYYTSPERWEGYPYLVGPRHCTECGTELLGVEGLDSDDTVTQVAATVVTTLTAKVEGEGEIVANDLCYGCWLDRD
jgi:hypothetical protein